MVSANAFHVMPVLVTGIHVFVATSEGVDARDEREHDE
jgi:hypothetical protein